nr:MAG TPA: hypothetical protein [Caudoviricetes sp.]
MNTFEDYVQKFIDMTNKNEIIWQDNNELHALIGISYECQYKGLAIQIRHCVLPPFDIITLKVNDTKKSESTDDHGILYTLWTAIAKQLNYFEEKKMLETLSVLDTK